MRTRMRARSGSIRGEASLCGQKVSSLILRLVCGYRDARIDRDLVASSGIAASDPKIPTAAAKLLARVDCDRVASASPLSLLPSEFGCVEGDASDLVR
jgi:hypothetical protein